MRWRRSQPVWKQTCRPSKNGAQGGRRAFGVGILNQKEAAEQSCAASPIGCRCR
ncbi:hypothetical protein ETW24_10080 [Leisingera sp. NJS204]|nr:hypothetical protein ETW24_10080 [Leisingera sp. NJS204]